MSRQFLHIPVRYTKFFERRKVSNLMKLQEVAKRLGVSEKSARRYVKSGELPSVFVGNAYRISEQDLVEYLEHARVRAGESGPKARTPRPLDDGAGDRSLRYLRAWRGFAWDLALEWRESPPQTSREIKPLLTAITALLDAGAFEDTNADTAARGEISLFLNALRKLSKIADNVESDEVAAELRRSIALVPRDHVA